MADKLRTRPPPIAQDQPLPLSVVVIALNEEARIGDCLDSARELTDDIIVVDAHSRDATCEIARAHGARVFQRRWTGYSEQKNFGNTQARHDWILSLDADERVTPELAADIRRAFAHGTPGYDAYSIRFQNYFGARRVRFGAWNPEWHVRLFDRRRCDWNTDEVHEGLRGVEGCEVGRLDGTVRHLTVDSLTTLAEKTERYSELFATKLRRRGRVPSWPKVWLNPMWRFGRDYFLRLGALDGAAGWCIAWEAARYTHLKYTRARPPSMWWGASDWRALGTAAAMLIALWVAAPKGGISVLWSATEQPAAPLPKGPAFGQNSDEDNNWLGLLPDDDDVLT